MYFDTHDHMNNTGRNTLAILESMVGVSLMAMQKIAELQFTFVTTHMENAMDQLKLLSNFDAAYDLFSAKPGLTGGPGARALVVTRKAIPQATAPKDKTARRKIRKRNS